MLKTLKEFLLVQIKRAWKWTGHTILYTARKVEYGPVNDCNYKVSRCGHYYKNIIFSFIENDTHCKCKYGCTSKYQKVPCNSVQGWFLHIHVSRLVITQTGKQWQLEFLVWLPFSFQMSPSLLDITNASGFGLGTFSKGKYSLSYRLFEKLSAHLFD